METFALTYSVQDVLLIIGAITTMVCSIIAALKTTTTGRKMDSHTEHLTKQDETLNTIETQTNGNLTDMRDRLAAARLENAVLKAAMTAKQNEK